MAPWGGHIETLDHEADPEDRRGAVAYPVSVFLRELRGAAKGKARPSLHPFLVDHLKLLPEEHPTLRGHTTSSSSAASSPAEYGTGVVAADDSVRVGVLSLGVPDLRITAARSTGANVTIRGSE